MNPLSGVFSTHSFEVFDERVLAITDVGIVLDIVVSDVFLDGFARLTLIKHQVIEGLGIIFVLLNVCAHITASCRGVCVCGMQGVGSTHGHAAHSSFLHCSCSGGLFDYVCAT
jgi:hypothetical protein